MSDGNSQLLPSRRHARVLPETIGTAVTLNVVKRLERVSPHLRNTFACHFPQPRAPNMATLPLPAAARPQSHRAYLPINPDSAYTRHTSVCSAPAGNPTHLPALHDPRYSFFFMLSRSSEPCVTRLRIGTLADGCRVAWFSPNRQQRCTEARGEPSKACSKGTKKTNSQENWRAALLP